MIKLDAIDETGGISFRLNNNKKKIKKLMNCLFSY